MSLPHSSLCISFSVRDASEVSIRKCIASLLHDCTYLHRRPCGAFALLLSKRLAFEKLLLHFPTPFLWLALLLLLLLLLRGAPAAQLKGLGRIYPSKVGPASVCKRCRRQLEFDGGNLAPFLQFNNFYFRWFTKLPD